MKHVLPETSVGPVPYGELARLRQRLAEAEDTLRAIRWGEVDAVVVSGRQGRQVFTLQGAEHAYRILIESMNEGALTFSGDKTILYANECFARMVKCPLEQVIGGSFRRFLSAQDRARLSSLLKRPREGGAKLQVRLQAGDGSTMPVQISLRPLARNGFKQALTGLVVTDMTEARRTEELLRALSYRQIQSHEAERGSVAGELHDHITQLLCALLFRSQTLAGRLSAHDRPSRKEVMKLRELLGQAAGEVERISRNLRPGVLEDLGLASVLRQVGAEFTSRSGVAVCLDEVELPSRPSADIELTLYRIFQEALMNVEKHAEAHNVSVTLNQPGNVVCFLIKDDGKGFVVGRIIAGSARLGLLAMRERAAHVGGTLRLKSSRRTGTSIEVRIPLPPAAGTA